MGQVGILFQATRRSRRRGVKLRSPRNTDMLVYSWMAVVIAIRVTENSLLALRELTRGVPAVGMAISEFTVFHVLTVSFLIPFLAWILVLGGTGLNTVRLELHAVLQETLLFLELAAFCARPLTGVMLVFLLPAAIPLAASAHPVLSITSLVVTFVAVLLLAAAAGRAFAAGWLARAVSGVLRYLVVLVMIALVLANFDFQWNGGAIQVFIFQNKWLLIDAQGSGLLPALRTWSPSTWIVQGRILPGVVLLAAALLLFAGAWRATQHAHRPSPGFGAGLRQNPDARERRTLSLLVPKELRRLLTRPSTVLGIVISIAFSAWLLIGKQQVALAGCLLVYLSSFSWITNMFGHDGRAIRRYALAGVQWNQIALSKALAWVVVMAASLLTLIVSEAVRVSLHSALSAGLAAAAVICVSLSWGIIGSMLFPSVEPSAGHAFVNQAAPFLLCGIALAFHRSGLPYGTGGFDLAMVLLLAAGIALFSALLRRLRKNFDSEIEDVLERMNPR